VPLYVMLMRNDPRGAEQMLQSGTAGATAQRETVVAYKGKVVAHMALLG